MITADISPLPAGFRARATTMLVAAFSPRTRILVASDCRAAAELLRPLNTALTVAKSAVARFVSQEATHDSGVMRLPAGCLPAPLQRVMVCLPGHRTQR